MWYFLRRNLSNDGTTLSSYTIAEDQSETFRQEVEKGSLNTRAWCFHKRYLSARTVHHSKTVRARSWQISVLVRDREKRAAIQKVFPDVKVVIGSLDDSDVIADAASQADIVIHTADSSDHAGSARAIASGLRSTHTSANPGYYIHISGTGILTWYDYQHSRYGQRPLPEQAYHDVDGLDAIKSLPDDAWHRDVDKIVLAEAVRDAEALKVAVVCPPTIYGQGRGPVNQRSRQVPLMIAMTLENGEGPVIGDGLTEWDNVHVHDLSDLILLLAQQASLPEPNANEQETFGANGYYFCENGTHKWSELAEIIVKEANKQGLVEGTGTKSLSADAAKEKYGMEPLTWGLNSKGKAARARRYLGWKPAGLSLADSVPDMVRYEAERRSQGQE